MSCLNMQSISQDFVERNRNAEIKDREGNGGAGGGGRQERGVFRVIDRL